MDRDGGPLGREEVQPEALLATRNPVIVSNARGNQEQIYQSIKISTNRSIT